MDYKELSFWFEVARWLITVLLGFFVWITSRQSAARAVTDEHARWLISLEAKAAMMPDHDDLSRMYERINTASKEMAAVKGELRQMNNTLKLINSYLINKGPQQ